MKKLLLILLLAFNVNADTADTINSDKVIECGALFRNAYLNASTTNAKVLFGEYSSNMAYYAMIQAQKSPDMSAQMDRWNDAVTARANELKAYRKKERKAVLDYFGPCIDLSITIGKVRKEMEVKRTNNTIIDGIEL